MPLYEYECGACGHRFEVIQKFSDSPIERCPLCAEPVHKLLSAPAIQFKGTGWYVTDYASKRNTDAAADKKSAASASSSAGASNGSKPSAAGDSGESKPSSDGSKPASGTSASSSEKSKTTSTADSSGSKADTKPSKSE